MEASGVACRDVVPCAQLLEGEDCQRKRNEPHPGTSSRGASHQSHTSAVGSRSEAHSRSNDSLTLCRLGARRIALTVLPPWRAAACRHGMCSMRSSSGSSSSSSQCIPSRSPLRPPSASAAATTASTGAEYLWCALSFPHHSSHSVTDPLRARIWHQRSQDPWRLLALCLH